MEPLRAAIVLIRKKAQELNALADGLEAELRKPAVVEEDIVIVDDDFLIDTEPEVHEARHIMSSQEFQADIANTIAGLLK